MSPAISTVLIVRNFADEDMPTHEEIARYWYCRALPGSNYVPLIDLGEPECFACGWCRQEQVRSEKALANLWKGLERAHVVPRSLGGPTSVENIILLCHACHLSAPDTSDASRFWRWVVDHPNSGALAYLFEISGPHDPRARDYTGPQAKDLHALSSLQINELNVLTEIWENNPEGTLRQRLHEAVKRIGGVSTHWGIGLSSGTVLELLREVVRDELASRQNRLEESG
ncbi:hypothetical protein Misp01_54520 [Microtetraspora sp. NBRC 13810]|uniref:HNH endonuclease n=1 Tax=Microtetraspora sp. NBRC 13810 TaxID=3030990 RepID=UPI0024A4CF5F|nr:HNH endonuclease signature motif containing protein [Microtetraspora sp. NBRC 13810]GLW10324.1 hypothetical protein Misp01_54520 [Microtetraspora sp. NBRC 13810]